MEDSSPYDDLASSLDFDDLEETPCTLLKNGVEFSELSSKGYTTIELDESYTEAMRKPNHQLQETVDNLFGLALGEDEGNGSSESDNELEPFEKISRKMEDISKDGGVLKQMIRPGIGPDFKSGLVVFFNYRAYLEYSDEPFDSTILRNKPIRHELMSGKLYSGLEVALMSMRKKEVARFLISADYAFGKFGCPPRIPGNATILCEITILNTNDYVASNDYDNLTKEDQKTMPFEGKIKAAFSYMKKASDSFKEKNFHKARSSYRRVTEVLENCNAQDEKDEIERRDLLIRTYSNLAMVNLELKQPARACAMCNLAFQLDYQKAPRDQQAKLYYRFSKAKMMLEEFKGASVFASKARRLSPNNEEVSNLEREILVRKKRFVDREKHLAMRMLELSPSSPKANEALVTDAVERPNYSSSDNTDTVSVSSDKNGTQVSPKHSRFLQDLKERIKSLCDGDISEVKLPRLNSEQLEVVEAIVEANDLQMAFLNVGKMRIVKIVRKL